MENKAIKLFKSYKEQGNLWSAYTVIKSAYNQETDNVFLFDAYLSFLMESVERYTDYEKLYNLISEANTLIEVFANAVELDVQIVALLQDKKHLVDHAEQRVRESMWQEQEKKNEKIHLQNQELLTELIRKTGELEHVKDQETFDHVLEAVNSIDGLLNQSALDEKQNRKYDQLTNQYTDLIQRKMQELKRVSMIEYNKLASNDFKVVFETFKASESKYTTDYGALYELTSKRLFSYDSGQLFNETLVYYNHVYGYIFSKMNDQGKFRLTQMAIDSEKK